KAAGAGADLAGEAASESRSLAGASGLPPLTASPFDAIAKGSPYTAQRFTQAVNDLQAGGGREPAPGLEAGAAPGGGLGRADGVRALAAAYVAMDSDTHRTITTVAEFAAAAVAAGVAVKALTVGLGFLSRNPLVLAAMAAAPVVLNEVKARQRERETDEAIVR